MFSGGISFTQSKVQQLRAQILYGQKLMQKSRASTPDASQPESLWSPFEKNIGRFTVNLDHPIFSKVQSEAREQARERFRHGITKDDLVGYVSIEDWER
jgi:hypothetical protein